METIENNYADASLLTDSEALSFMLMKFAWYFTATAKRVANGGTKHNDGGDNGLTIYTELFSIIRAHNILFWSYVGDGDGANNTTQQLCSRLFCKLQFIH